MGLHLGKRESYVRAQLCCDGHGDRPGPSGTIAYPANGTTYNGNYNTSWSGTGVAGTGSVANVYLGITRATDGSIWSGSSWMSGLTSIDGTTMTGASTTLTVGSTTGYATSGTISVQTASGILVFSYTNTTATSFTGVTRVNGLSTWTIANATTVTPVFAAAGMTNWTFTGLGTTNLTNTDSYAVSAYIENSANQTTTVTSTFTYR